MISPPPEIAVTTTSAGFLTVEDENLSHRPEAIAVIRLIELICPICKPIAIINVDPIFPNPQRIATVVGKG